MVNSRNVFGLTGKLVAGAALAYLMMSCGAKEEAKKIASGAGGGSVSLSATYAAKCASCHGASGQGGSARALNTSTLSATAWETTVRLGRTGTSMGSYAVSVYSEADLAADYKAITGK